MSLFDIFFTISGIYLIYLLLFCLPRKKSYDEYISRKIKEQEKRLSKEPADSAREFFK